MTRAITDVERLHVLDPKDTFLYNGLPHICIISSKSFAAIVEIVNGQLGPEGLTFKFLKENAIVIGNTLFDFPYSKVEDLRSHGSQKIIDLAPMKDRAKSIKDYCRVVVDNYNNPSFVKPVESQYSEINISVDDNSDNTCS